MQHQKWLLNAMCTPTERLMCDTTGPIRGFEAKINLPCWRECWHIYESDWWPCNPQPKWLGEGATSYYFSSIKSSVKRQNAILKHMFVLITPLRFFSTLLKKFDYCSSNSFCGAPLPVNSGLASHCFASLCIFPHENDLWSLQSPSMQPPSPWKVKIENS